jgi:tRNA(Ile)-lysidine synthase
MKKKNLSAKKKIHNFYSKKLDNPRIRKIYLNFKKKLSDYKPKKLSVAVSGGADSMALSFLAKCYSLEKNINVSFFIVDHKLRKNSTYEANLVKSKLKQFKIRSEILTIKKKIKSSNLQSFARENRYKLIFKNSLNKKIDIVLTAHHRDDLLENFFIRLLRGSGLKGLISFGKLRSKVYNDDKIFILRPLIDLSKKDLTYVVKHTFDFNVEDPSNFEDKFLRVKIRDLITKLEKEGLSFEKFKLSLDHLGKSNSAIDYYVKKNITNNSNFLIPPQIVVLKEKFLKQPDEIVFRSFSEIIQKVGKRKSYTRGLKVENLINYLRFSKNIKKKTLSGCIIQKINNTVIISKENN